jgi:putative inorganic carbon (hco3(-)) transporter
MGSDISASAGALVRQEASPFDSPIAYWSLIFLTFIMFIAPMGYLPFLIPLRLAFVSAVLAALTYLLSVSTQGRKLSVWNTEVKIILWLALFAILSIPSSRWRGGSYEMLFDTYLKSVIVFFLIANLLSTDKRIRTFLWALTLYSAFNAVVGIQNYRTGNFLNGRITGGYSGLTSNPNDLALSLNLIIPFMGYLYLTSGSGLKKALAAASLIGSIACIVATWSRSGALSLFAMLLWFVWWRSGTKRIGAMLGVSILIVLALALAPQGYSDRLASTTDFSKDDGSAAARWETTKAGFRQTFEHPLGIGLGMNGLMNHDEGMGWSAGVHNVYLQISTETGIIPAILYIMLLWKLIWGMKEIGTLSEQKNVATLGDALACTFVGFAVEAFFSPVAYNFYFYIIAGIAVATKQIIKSTAVSRQATGSHTSQLPAFSGSYPIARTR